ncbi:MAG: hypothetical protein CR982_05725 [Candidatus Cloacimonadota bacterium]|nr:MAG: hypothetical protein CR982_05725 [Candidatus Cloacimonadota bacterium]PIE81380.1 MAG: hypothetical protein CSA15_00645 [Candidatus Delongbacteria bacterium]
MKLPIGIQTFSEIREDNYIYVDKTKEAWELINSYKYVFLSRPRRFGKSLFLDTLKSIFEGKKEYFKGLYIEKRYDFSQKFPVIHISFAGNLSTKEGIDGVFNYILKKNIEALKVNVDDNLDIPNKLSELIQKTYEKYNQKVVVLVDEYDKPILDNITEPVMREYAKKSLKAFYEILKRSDKYLKFVFLTGVSKFSKVSIFSGLNNLEDITLNNNFGNICGYTHSDIETAFKPLLQGVDLEKLKEWYNGYYFLKDKVYNPFDILLFIRGNLTYKNYWFETGNPSFLIDLIKKNNYYLPNLENIVVGEEILNSFEIENINLEALLFQSGYLTVKKRYINPADEILYSLKMPNKEIKQSLNRSVLKMMLLNVANTQVNKNKTLYSLFDAKLEDFKSSLISLFASLPYQNYVKNNINIYEGFYSSVIYSYLASLGFPISVEESTNMGRLDMSLLVNNHRYIFEFKVGNENAISQIKENRYYEKFLSEESDIYLVGINFDEEKKNISSFEWEKFR